MTQIGVKQPESIVESSDSLYSAYTAEEHVNDKGSEPRLGQPRWIAAEEATQADRSIANVRHAAK